MACFSWVLLKRKTYSSREFLPPTVQHLFTSYHPSHFCGLYHYQETGVYSAEIIFSSFFRLKPNLIIGGSFDCRFNMCPFIALEAPLLRSSPCTTFAVLVLLQHMPWVFSSIVSVGGVVGLMNIVQFCNILILFWPPMFWIFIYSVGWKLRLWKMNT